MNVENAIENKNLCELARANGKCEKPYDVLLYYAYQECEDGIYHAFEAVDPDKEHDADAIINQLGKLLDCGPEDHGIYFNSNAMYIRLPDEVVQKIKSDAINEYMARNAENTKTN